MVHKLGSAFGRASGILLAALFLVLFSVVSCEGFQKDADAADAKSVAELLKKGDAKSLGKMSASPFLLDKEIIAVPADVAVFWEGAVKGGFALPKVEEDQAAGADQKSAEKFSSSMEVQNFFKHYLPKNSRLLSFRTADDKRVLLIVAHIGFDLRIIGFKGPY